MTTDFLFNRVYNTIDELRGVLRLLVNLRNHHRILSKSITLLKHMRALRCQRHDQVRILVPGSLSSNDMLVRGVDITWLITNI